MRKTNMKQENKYQRQDYLQNKAGLEEGISGARREKYIESR